MKNIQNIQVRHIVRGGVIAAVYILLTLLLAPISFGPLQLRVSEALTVLPIFLAEAIPGLFIGCFLANLLAGAPWQDVVFGPLATLLAACLTYLLRKKPLAAMAPPVLVNAVIVGIVLSWTWGLPLFLTMGEVFLGQVGACYVLGLLLFLAMKRVPDGLLR